MSILRHNQFAKPKPLGCNSLDVARTPRFSTMLSLADAGAVDGDGDERRIARPAPDREHVLVWRGSDAAWVAGHTATLEVQQLRRADGDIVPEVGLAYDEEGFTSLVLHSSREGHNPEIIAAIDVFSGGAYIDDGGALYLDTPGEPEGGSLALLRDLVNAHAIMTLELVNMAPLWSTMRLDCAIFDRPRSDGCHILVSMSSIIKKMALDPRAADSNNRGRWVFNIWPSWEQFVSERLGGCGILLRSQPYENGQNLEGALNDGRVLPSSSGALPAVLCVLGHMGWAPPMSTRRCSGRAAATRASVLRHPLVAQLAARHELGVSHGRGRQLRPAPEAVGSLGRAHLVHRHPRGGCCAMAGST